MILDNPISYVLVYLFLWVLLIAVVILIAKLAIKQQNHQWVSKIIINMLTTAISIAFIVLSLEGYFGFFYDKTDSYGYLLTSVRWFKRHYRLNNVGLRDNKHYFYEKGPGKKRIVFVGDSFTAGHGIKDVRERFTGIIEERLKKAFPDGNYEVYTIAVNGWETDDEVDYFNRLFEEGFKADEIILCFNMNDIAWASPKKQSTFKLLNEKAPKNWLLQHSFFLNFLYIRIGMFSTHEYKNYFDWLSESYEGKTWELEKMLLWKFKEVCVRNGCTLKVVILPLIGDLSGGFRLKASHDKVASFFRSVGIPYIDLSKRLSGFPAKKLTVNKFDAHPNEFAHNIIAEEIWELLAFEHVK